jgi:hypothetical protein
VQVKTSPKLVGLTCSALLALGGIAISGMSAEAVVYCNTVGIPKGCVVRPVARAVVAPGVEAPGVGVRPGTPMNRGGPVNRVGRY